MLNLDVQGNIECTSWGSIDGVEVVLICLRNETGTRMYVSNYGATVQALFCQDRKGVYDDILLGYDSLAEYVKDTVYMGSVVGRYANRIAGSEVNIDGQPYTLPTRPGGYHLHGGVEGFNKKIFDFSTGVVPGGQFVAFSYNSPHMEEGFPGELKLKVTYTLKDDNSWVIDYHAVTDRTTLVNLTQHAYFNLSGHQQGSIEKHQLRLNGRYYLPVTPLQVPTGMLENVRGTAFDFLASHSIGERIEADNDQLHLSKGYDHSWVLEKEHTPFLKHAGVVHDPLSGRKLDVYTTEPAVHFYSGNFLDSIKGKENTTYQPRAGFCLETQHFPDAPNHPHFPSTVLKPGEVFSSQTIFRLSVL